jgi:uncharacterized protein (TIGR02594 family)
MVIKLGSKSPDVARLQNLLNSALKPSPNLKVDGAFGQKTHDAVVRFQKNRALAADGIVGPATWSALGQKPQAAAPVAPAPAKPVSPARPWMPLAEAELGVHENAAVGRHNSRIIEFHRSTTLRATEDEVPWCSSFVNWVMTQAGRTGTNSAAAKSWLNWGATLTTPQVGAITIIKKKAAGADQATGSSSGFHVGFFVSGSATQVRLLGGNQSDSVKYSSFSLSKYDVKGYRWPR